MRWLLDRFTEDKERDAFVHLGRRVTYGEVIETVQQLAAQIERAGVSRGDIVAVVGDYSPEVFCYILALSLEGAIIVPMGRESIVEMDKALSISGCDWLAEFDSCGRSPKLSRHRVAASKPLLDEFRKAGHAGLILYSSGSTGEPKAILHDFHQVAEKFRKRRDAIVAIPFLMIDHFGGINTILAITSSLGTIVTVGDRSVANICRAIDEHNVELLPATPSFLTMLVASHLDHEFDLGSLRRVTYGTEVMPQATLDRLCQRLPGVTFQQTYGLSEVGVLRSKSRSDGSLWVKIGGDGFALKVVEEILWIKSDYRMVGYLNAPSGFDEDGWFNTQDRVEVDGDWFRILGRVTDLINVGGQKVYPAEVEDAILELDNVRDVAVSGEAHPLLGQIVVARVKLEVPEDPAALKQRIRMGCRAKLSSFKVPVKVIASDDDFYTVRHKKSRRFEAASVTTSSDE